MRLYIENMKREHAEDILGWRYKKPYDFYNNEPTAENMKEFLDGSYFTLVNDDNDLAGFFCVGKNAQVPAGHNYGVYIDPFIDIGFGMHPELTGKGNGSQFCSFIINIIEKKHKKTTFRLTVAKFNTRAIHLYENLGFEMKDEFRNDYREFITMVRI